MVLGLTSNGPNPPCLWFWSEVSVARAYAMPRYLGANSCLLMPTFSQKIHRAATPVFGEALEYRAISCKAMSEVLGGSSNFVVVFWRVTLE
jgi:hypothetical protein